MHSLQRACAFKAHTPRRDTERSPAYFHLRSHSHQPRKSEKTVNSVEASAPYCFSEKPANCYYLPRIVLDLSPSFIKRFFLMNESPFCLQVCTLQRKFALITVIAQIQIRIGARQFSTRQTIISSGSDCRVANLFIHRKQLHA